MSENNILQNQETYLREKAMRITCYHLIALRQTLRITKACLLLDKNKKSRKKDSIANSSTVELILIQKMENLMTYFIPY